MKLKRCIFEFFDNYLPHIKGCSLQTIKSYRDTFTLFLPFAAQQLSIKIESLTVDHLSADLIIAFLHFLESNRHNAALTRNQRLAAIKSLAKMIRFIYPDKRKLADTILAIPQKRSQRKLIGFLYPEEIFKVCQNVDLRKKDGFRDYTILQLLYDTGARASEIATLKLDYFDPKKNTLAILGKANRYRQITLAAKASQLLNRYIAKYRGCPKPLYKEYLFINQRGTAFTRHGINRICKRYLKKALSPKRLKHINPAHSFRHSCAVKMLAAGDPISDIKNRLGHVNVQSTTDYLQLDLSRRKQIQKDFIRYAEQNLKADPKIKEFIGWENKNEILSWLDSL